MKRVKHKRHWLGWGLLLILLTGVVVGCSGIRLPESYVDTARFLDQRPVQKENTAFQIEVKPFQHQLKNPNQVGIKRVGVNEINGPLLPSQDVLPIVQNSVLTQLGLKGIARGTSPLQLEGTIRDFFVDVDVDPASGRGRFNAIVAVDLAVWDTALQKHIWQERYTGTATSSAPSVVDSAYERTLKVAFTNLMNQLRQDDSILELKTAYDQPPLPEESAILQQLKQQKPLSAPAQHPAPAALPVSPQIVFLKPALNGSSQIITTDITLPISGLVASTSQVEVHITGAKARIEEAPPQLLKQAGLSGSGMRFQAFVFLIPGINRVEVRAEDEQGNKTQQSITIQRQDIVDNTQPQLVVLDPHMAKPLSLIAAKPSQAIFGYAADERGIAEVRVNGVTASMTVASPRELQEAGLTGKGVKFVVSAALEMGDNALEIMVRDIYQNEARERLIIQRKHMAEKTLDIKAMYPKSVAVVIGIDHYDAWPQLTYAVEDAKHMQKALKDLGFDEVLTLTDKEATRARILHLLEAELPQKVGDKDRVLIFFAGHAQTANLPDGRQMGYLLPVNAQRENYTATGIAMEQIRTLAERIPSKHVLFAIDACYSGLLLRPGGATAQALDQDTRLRAQNWVTSPAIQLVAAGRSGEQVVPEEGQGLFTRFLMQGLQGEADTDNDLLITTTELGTYLSRHVSVISDNRQTPQYGPITGTGEVVFVY